MLQNEEAVGTNRIAVAVVHGIGKQNPNFADELMAKLTEKFANQLSGKILNPHTQLVIEPIHWAPVMQDLEDLLWKRLSRGSVLDFIKLRQFMVEFGADALAYQPLPRERAVYEAVHGVVARGFRNLADKVGPNAPLCVIAHSLGTVIASNYLYDLQKGYDFLPESVQMHHQQTPLEMGETLAFFYTLGSPIALWSLRYSDFGRPISVPSPHLAKYHPDLNGEWVNFYDADDVIGFPLRTLNDEYRKVVKKDVEVNVGSFLTSWSPLSHLEYWTDDDVLDPIAKILARAWKKIN
ncbi:MAG: hypothetical protein JXM69_07100 [Anaerolineae bacterium]|nr:hypothetical protein [Anaerolineae bacterium]